MKRMPVWIAGGLLMVALAGCHPFRSFQAKEKSCHKPQTYASAQSVAPLQIPAGLDAPDTTNALRIPQLKDPPPPPRKGTDPCLDEPPPFKVVKPVAPQA